MPSELLIDPTIDRALRETGKVVVGVADPTTVGATTHYTMSLTILRFFEEYEKQTRSERGAIEELKRIAEGLVETYLDDDESPQIAIVCKSEELSEIERRVSVWLAGNAGRP